MMSSDEIKDVLISLGYELVDRGDYWQTNALFRNGDNKTALQIYKDTGVWKDFVEGPAQHLKFERLVEKSVADPKELKKILGGKTLEGLERRRPTGEGKIKSEEIYPADCLKKLLPHYRFYNDRGISDHVLESLRSGLATQGQMYQRYVFPIYNEFGQIHGFSGRDMLNKDNRPKWKHMGRKSQWLYPIYVPGDSPSFRENLEAAEAIFLVESIGDLLALHEQGHYNVLVTFGVDIGPRLLSLLVGLNPSKIIISFNNDRASSPNPGLVGSLKNYLKLLTYFDYPKLFICLPTANDFGDMDAENFEKWQEKVDNLDPTTHASKVLEQSLSLAKGRQLSKKLIKNRNFLLKSLDE